MGKRQKGGLSGISRFVFESMKSATSNADVQNDSSKNTTSLSTAYGSGSSTQQAVIPDELLTETRNVPMIADPNTDESTESRPLKKRKANDGSAVIKEFTSTQREAAGTSGWISRYDASGLVPHYTDASQVPEHLKKYEEGWYSVTPESVADQIAERCRCDTILDAFCGVGGNAIAFAKTCQCVIALDTSPTRLALARHNAQIYGVADRIEFILSDYISFVKSFLSLPKARRPGTADTEKGSTSNHTSRKIDVIFLSPPWGGPSYLDGSAEAIIAEPPTTKSKGKAKEPATPTPEHPSYSLSSIQPIHGAELFDLSRKITKNIAYFLPRNTRLDEISDLLTREEEREMIRQSVSVRQDGSAAKSTATGQGEEHVEIEEEWMGNKLKALTCYFGGLATGQEDMF